MFKTELSTLACATLFRTILKETLLCLEHNSELIKAQLSTHPLLATPFFASFLAQTGPDISQASKHLIEPTYNLYIQTHKYLPQVVIKISRPCKQIPDTTPLRLLLLVCLCAWRGTSPTNNPETRFLFLLKRSLQIR